MKETETKKPEPITIAKNVHHLSYTTWVLLWTTMLAYLKFTGVIDWHWAWVLAPFWIPVGAGTVVNGIRFYIMRRKLKKAEAHMKEMMERVMAKKPK